MTCGDEPAPGCDLERLYGDLGRRVPVADDEELVLTAALLAPPGASIATDRVVVRRGAHLYGGAFHADHLHVHARPETYRRLALLALAVLLRRDAEEVTLALTHPASEVRRLVLRRPRMEAFGLRLEPEAFEYWPASPERHPWVDEREPSRLPTFSLTDEQELGGVTPEERARHDTVVGFGGHEGAARLAQLWLDLGRPACPRDEFVLEGDAGFRGVGYMSAEVTFWLPGSLGWEAWPPELGGL